jgi:hypothetical protein
MGSDLAHLKELFGEDVEGVTFDAVLTALGFGVHKTLDVSPYEGCDIVADLNVPITSRERFDLIVDNGTIEHCFNVGQAFLNVKKLCAVGGVIFHNNPANWFGHGFWNMSPCVYFDFYRANGFDVSVFLRDVSTGTYTEIEYKPRVTKILAERRYVIHAVARKLREQPDMWPTQGRYILEHAESGRASQETKRQ